MTDKILLGAVAYDPKVVTIWEGFKKWFAGRGLSFDELRTLVAERTGTEPAVADLDDLGEFVVDGVVARRFVIARDLDATADLLHRRADAIGAGVVPPQHELRA